MKWKFLDMTVNMNSDVYAECLQHKPLIVVKVYQRPKES